MTVPPLLEPPLLLWESGDLHIFDSVPEAESWLEAVDVRDGIYRGFDARGRLLMLGTSLKVSKVLGLLKTAIERVVISSAEEVPGHREELRGILLKFLAACGDDSEALGRMSLDELIVRARPPMGRRNKRPMSLLIRLLKLLQLPVAALGAYAGLAAFAGSACLVPRLANWLERCDNPGGDGATLPLVALAWLGSAALGATAATIGWRRLLLDRIARPAGGSIAGRGSGNRS